MLVFLSNNLRLQTIEFIMKNILFLFLIVTGIIACSKDTNHPQLSFNLDGKQWISDSLSCQYAKVSNRTTIHLNSISNTPKGVNKTQIRILDFNGVGAYKPLTKGKGFVLVLTELDTTTQLTKAYALANQDQVINVTAYDETNHSISGTFDLKLQHAQVPVALTNGRFDDIILEKMLIE